jgi:hypothetical protein
MELQIYNTLKDIYWYRLKFYKQFMERMMTLSKTPGKETFYRVQELTGVVYSKIGFDSIIFKAKNKYELWLKINNFEYNTNNTNNTNHKKHNNILWSDFKLNYDTYDSDTYDYNNKTDEEIVEHLIDYEIKARDRIFYNELELYWIQIDLVV